jgi:hypothetical protein
MHKTLDCNSKFCDHQNLLNFFPFDFRLNHIRRAGEPERKNFKSASPLQWTTFFHITKCFIDPGILGYKLDPVAAPSLSVKTFAAAVSPIVHFVEV